MANPIDLYSFVQGEYDAGRKQRDGNRLKALYQQALSGPPQNQRAIVGQVAGIDPSQAQGLYNLLNGRAEDQRKAVGQRAALVRALPQEQRQAAYEGIRPDLDAAGLYAPGVADDGYLGAVAQTFGGLGSTGDSAEWRMFNNLTSMGNLTPEERAQAARVKLRLAPGAVGAARKAVTIKLRNGLEVPGEFDHELGYTVWDSSQNAMVPLGRGDIAGVRYQGGQGRPDPTQGDMEGDIALANSMIAAGIPEAQVDAFLRSRGQRAEQPGAIAPSGIQSMIGSQTPAEKAYTEQAAKTQAELDSGQAVTRMEADRAAAVEAAKQRAQNAADKEKNAPKVRQQLQTARFKFENLDRSIGQAINGANVWSAGMLGKPLAAINTPAAANLRAQLNTIEANLGFSELQAMRMASPTGGAVGSVTERELELLASTITSVQQSQSPEQLRSNLKFLRQQYAKVLRQMELDYEQDYGGGAAQGGRPAARDGAKRTRIKL